MRRCIWCAEDPGKTEEVCEACGRSQKGEDGRPLRRVDILYDAAVDLQRRRYREVMTVGVGAFALISIAAPVFVIAAPLVAAVLLILHMVLLRLYLFRDSFRLLSGRRRFFVRWITRLGLIVAGTFGYSTTVTPVAGAVTGAGTFAILSAATNAYVFRSLRRERLGLPLEAWEKVTLVVLAVLFLVVVALAIAIGAAVGWGIAELRQLSG